MKTTVGRFTIDENGTIEGPAEYLQSPWFDAFLSKLHAGQSAVFNYPTPGASTATKLLVAIQTDYAAWRGMQSLRIGR